MTQYPSGTPERTFGVEDAFVEPRTSGTAVVSLVLGILSVVTCCIPVVSPVVGVAAVVLAVVALVRIGSAQGRLMGRGLAMGGLVTGIIAMVMGLIAIVTIVGGLNAFRGEVTRPMSELMSAVESGDVGAVKQKLAPAAQAAVSDADVVRFRDQYRAELGSFKGVPQGMMELVSAFVGVMTQPSAQAVQSRNDVLPFPGVFDKGTALVAVQIDPVAGGGSVMPLNVSVFLPSGKAVHLYEPPGGGLGSPPAPPAIPGPDGSGPPTGTVPADGSGNKEGGAGGTP